MSPQRDDFIRRTTIFEAAFRAWSHLGGLSPELLETRSSQELDPITFRNPGGSLPRVFAFENLPSSGNIHPFVNTVLLTWLGTIGGAEKAAPKNGLKKLQVWWQHRRKGLNRRATKQLGNSDAVRQELDRYTRHFFMVARRLVVDHNWDAPPTLEKARKRARQRQNAPKEAEREHHLQAAQISSMWEPEDRSSTSDGSTSSESGYFGECFPFSELDKTQSNTGHFVQPDLILTEDPYIPPRCDGVLQLQHARCLQKSSPYALDQNENVEDETQYFFLEADAEDWELTNLIKDWPDDYNSQHFDQQAKDL